MTVEKAATPRVAGCHQGCLANKLIPDKNETEGSDYQQDPGQRDNGGFAGGVFPNAYVIILGSNAPLNMVWFNREVDMLCGSIVENINTVVESILNGDNLCHSKR